MTALAASRPHRSGLAGTTPLSAVAGGLTGQSLTKAIKSQRDAALAHLAEVRKANHGRISGEVMEEVAELLGLGVPHLRRLVREYECSGTIRKKATCSKAKIVLPDEWKAKVAYFQFNGCARAAYDALREKGALPERMDLRTFQRRVNEWDPAIRACASGGYRAMVQHQFFNVEHIPHRGYAFGTDHTFLPIQVVPSRGSTKPFWPWCTTVMDLKSRLVLSYTLSESTPNAETSLNTLVEAIHGWSTEDGTFVGGKPEFIRSDRGGDFISKALSSNLINLDIARQFTEPYSSWQNGRVERLNGTIDNEFAPQVPGFHPGGEAEYTRRVLKTPLNVTSMLTFDTLDRRLGDFFGDYNNRPHSSLNGMTPLEAWAADDHPITQADRGTLLHAMTPRDTRSVQHYGVEIRGNIYGGPAVAQLRKRNVRSVEVRYHQHDLDHIELFVDGTHQGTATRSRAQPDHERLGVLSIRGKQRRDAEAYIRAADYERVVDERERLREEGIDEAQWPALPEEPALDEDSDDPLSDLSPSTLGFGLSARATSNWSKRLDEAEAAHTDTPTN